MAGSTRFPKRRYDESSETPRSVYAASGPFHLRGIAETLGLPDFRKYSVGINENGPPRIGGMGSVDLAPQNATPFILNLLLKALKTTATGFVRSIRG